MYRDDAAALEERGAALEEQLAPLRVSGPPGGVARIAELEEQRRRLRRFAWPYAWLALVPVLPLSLAAWPALLAVGHLWIALARQRRALARRQEELSTSAPTPNVVAATTTTSTDATRILAEAVAHQEALGRELAVYRATGTRDQALAAEMAQERVELARHGRAFPFLTAALLILILPTGGAALDAMSVWCGALGLTLAAFALRLWSHGRALADRLALARRELRRAERGAEGLLGSAATGVDGQADSLLQEQARAVQRARDEVERRRAGRDAPLQSAARASAAALASAFGLLEVLFVGHAPVLGTGALVFSAILGLVLVLAVAHGGRAMVTLAATNRTLRLAQLEEDAEEHVLQRLRVAGAESAAAAPRARIATDAADAVEDRVDDSLSPSARYTNARELP